MSAFNCLDISSRSHRQKCGNQNLQFSLRRNPQCQRLAPSHVTHSPVWRAATSATGGSLLFHWLHTVRESSTMPLKPAVFRSCAQRVVKRKYSSAIREQRDVLLRQIYKPFTQLRRGSPEYIALARSGLVWEDYHKPYELGPYLAVQKKLESDLAAASDFKRTSNHLQQQLTSSLTQEYSHQSTAIEGNTLSVGDSGIINDALVLELFEQYPGADLKELFKVDLPSPSSLLPGKDPNQVAELRNHVIAIRIITQYALDAPNTAGLNLEQIRSLSKLLLIGTDAENLYKYGWGGKVELGEFRQAPISV